MAVKVKKQSRKEAIAQQRKKKKTMASLIYGAVGLALIGLVALFLISNQPPGEVQNISIPAGYITHVQTGLNPGPYPSNPPAGGLHYPQSLPGGFYDDEEAAKIPQYQEGYLVHSLEHGYVIFWYNCDLLSQTGCENLKSQINDVLDTFNSQKVIAFPWNTIDVPVAATSWGKLLEFPKFDPDAARQFVRQNRNRSPEPNGQ